VLKENKEGLPLVWKFSSKSLLQSLFFIKHIHVIYYYGFHFRKYRTNILLLAAPLQRAILAAGTVTGGSVLPYSPAGC